MEILLTKTPDRASFFFLSPCGIVWVIHLHSTYFSYPVEYSVDPGSKYRVHSKLVVMFFVPCGPPREAGPWRTKWCRSPEDAWCQEQGSGVWVQVSLNTELLGYFPPGSVVCGSKLMVHLAGEFRRVRHQGWAVCFARDLAVGVVDLRQGLLPCIFLLPESGLLSWNAIKMLVPQHKM